MNETPSLYANAIGAGLDAASEPKRTRHKANYGHTAVEVAVLHAASWGLTNRQIAQALELKPVTVAGHFEHIFGQSPIPGRGRANAVLRAIDNGDITFEEATGGLDLRRVRDGLLNLTSREGAVFRLLLTDDGVYRDRKAIAAELVLVERTVEIHLERIYRKLGLESEFPGLQVAVLLSELRKRNAPDRQTGQPDKRRPSYFELRELGLVDESRDAWQVTRDIVQCAGCLFAKGPLTRNRVEVCSRAPSPYIVGRKMDDLVARDALERVGTRGILNGDGGGPRRAANEIVYQATGKITSAPVLRDSPPLQHCQGKILESTSSQPDFRRA